MIEPETLTTWFISTPVGEDLRVDLQVLSGHPELGGVVRFRMTDELGTELDATFNAWALRDLGTAIGYKLDELRIAPPPDRVMIVVDEDE